MQTLAQAWNEFQEILPVDMPLREAQQMEAAFYSGASKMLQFLHDDVTLMPVLIAECHVYAVTDNQQNNH